MKKLSTLFTAAFMFAVFSTALSQTVVKGKVVDSELDSPIPSANVIEKGAQNGTITDFEGNFSLTAKDESGEIVISYIGYTSVTIAFDGSQDLGTVTLKADNTLDEVVVVGSGVIDLANTRETPVAVSTVKKDIIQQRAIGNVEVPEIIKYTPSTYVSGRLVSGILRFLCVDLTKPTSLLY